MYSRGLKSFTCEWKWFIKIWANVWCGLLHHSNEKDYSLLLLSNLFFHSRTYSLSYRIAGLPPSNTYHPFKFKRDIKSSVFQLFSGPILGKIYQSGHILHPKWFPLLSDRAKQSEEITNGSLIQSFYRSVLLVKLLASYNSRLQRSVWPVTGHHFLIGSCYCSSDCDWIKGEPKRVTAVGKGADFCANPKS
jgi:hypothetical protein